MAFLDLTSLLSRPVALAPAAKSSLGILGCWPDNFDLSSRAMVSSRADFLDRGEVRCEATGGPEARSRYSCGSRRFRSLNTTALPYS